MPTGSSNYLVEIHSAEHEGNHHNVRHVGGVELDVGGGPAVAVHQADVDKHPQDGEGHHDHEAHGEGRQDPLGHLGLGADHQTAARGDSQGTPDDEELTHSILQGHFFAPKLFYLTN